MGEKLKQAWNWLTKSRYVRQLESDRERLLADNRAMVDSLLAHMGAPTISEMQSHKDGPLPKTKGRMLPSQWRRKVEASVTPKEEN